MRRIGEAAVNEGVGGEEIAELVVNAGNGNSPDGEEREAEEHGEEGSNEDGIAKTTDDKKRSSVPLGPPGPDGNRESEAQLECQKGHNPRL